MRISMRVQLYFAKAKGFVLQFGKSVCGIS